MTEDVEADEVLAILGLGKWHFLHYVWITAFFLAWATQNLSIVILGFTPDFACLSKDVSLVNNNTNWTAVTFGQSCSWTNATSTSCEGGIVYNEPKHVSIVSEWDLICEKGFLSDLSQTLFTVGMTVGTAVFSPLSDMFGRRKLIIGTQAALLVVSVATSFVNSMALFVVFRIFIGAFLSGSGLIQWVLLLEIFTPRHRTHVALWANVIWGVATCVLPGLGFAMRGLSWRYVQLVLSALSICIVGQFFFLDESLRWLLANNRYKEALKVTKKALAMNGVKSSTSQMGVDFSLRELIQTNSGGKFAGESEQLSSHTDTAHTPPVSPLDLLRHPSLRKITLILTVAWFTNSLIYGGLAMITSVMPGDRYLNLFLSAVVEIPASLASIPLILKFGRRNSCIVLHLLAGISLISAIAVYFTSGKTADVIEICVVVLGKFSIAGSFNLLYMYSPELYPTNIRSLGAGVATVASRVGGLIYPFTTSLARMVRWLPTTVFGGLAFIVAICCVFLPETADKDLPQTLEDADRLYGKKKEKQVQD